MRRIVVIGEGNRVRGYGLTGATVIEAEDHPSIVRAWDELPSDAALVILTAAAAAILRHRLAERPRVVWAAMP